MGIPSLSAANFSLMLGPRPRSLNSKWICRLPSGLRVELSNPALVLAMMNVYRLSLALSGAEAGATCACAKEMKMGKRRRNNFFMSILGEHLLATIKIYSDGL